MRKVCSAAVLLLLLAACGGDSPDKLVASAKDYLAKNDTKAAVIQLKNALQSNPNQAEARFLLGSALLAGRDPVAAEVELRKAFDLKYSPDDVVPRLAQAMVDQGKFKRLTDEFGKTELQQPAAKAQLSVVLSSAYTGLNNRQASDAALAAALAAVPDYGPAVLMLARQKASERKTDAALADVEKVIAGSPSNPDAWKLKGDLLLYSKGDKDGALVAYRKAVEQLANYVPGHIGAIGALLAQGKIEEAAKQLDQLKAVAGGHPQTRFAEAQIAYQRGDMKKARELTQQLLKSAPNNPLILQLAGGIEFQMNSLIQAEAYLSKAMQADQELPVARRVLIATYLRTGQTAKARALLPADLDKDNRNAEMLQIAGQVYLQSGDPKKAEEYFQRAAKLDPNDPRKRTSVAIAHLATGRTDAAFAELQSIAATDKGSVADLTMISALLRRKEYDKALKAIDQLEKKQPNQAMIADMRGKTFLAKRDVASARKAFEQALAIDAGYFPAMASLGALDVADKKPELARKRFDDALAKNPKNVQALVAVVELRAKAGAPKEELADLIGKAIAANGEEATPRLLLVNLHLQNKEFKKALSAAQDGVAALPASPELLDALGQAQVATEDYNQAITTYGKLAGMQPMSPMPHLRSAGVYMAAKNPDAAAQSLRKALEIKPDLLDAQRGLIGLQLAGQKGSEALSVAKGVQKQRPQEPVGYVLEGDILVSQKKWEAATAAYQAALKNAPGAPELGIKLNAIYRDSGKNAEADRHAQAWLKEHPKDVVFLLYLGGLTLSRNDYPAAEKYYKTIVQLQPQNAAVINNLAWVTGKMGNVDAALNLAESANKLAPDQPLLMDTWAMLLSEKNDHPKAIDLQTKAVAAQPQNASLKLNLAKIYLKANDKTRAKQALDDLAGLGDKFDGQAEVAKLRQAL